MKVTLIKSGILSSVYKDFESSISVCLRQLGIDDETIQNWSDTGEEGPYLTNEKKFLGYTLRNLCIAEKTTRNDKLFVADPILYQVYRKAIKRFEEPHYEKMKNKMLESLGLEYSGRFKAVNILHLMKSQTGGKKFDRLIIRKLGNDRDEDFEPLRIALHTPPEFMRPMSEIKSDHPDNPMVVSSLIHKAGGKCVNWGSFNRWLGGYLTVNLKNESSSSFNNLTQDYALKIITPVIRDAHESNAEVIATLDPRGLEAIDIYQQKIIKQLGINKKPLPVMYATDLINISLGMSANRINSSSRKTNYEEIFKKLGLSTA
tara:strand:+ start:2373 stop:3323 length:951 start_codon:yes stop_codon:yes gene_type:complete